MSKERLHYLLKCYAQGHATPDEVEELTELVESGGHNEALLSLWDESVQKNRKQPVNPEMLREGEIIFDELLKKIRQSKETPIHKPRRRRLVRISAAAAVILAVVGTVFYFSHRDVENLQETNVLVQDIPPGGNKAILTLANGQTIILDSAHTGQLASQGRSKVIKVDSGLISYSRQLAAGSNQSSISSNQLEIQYNTLTTPRGGQYQLVLPDGSKVWLNAASSIRFPAAFTGKTRLVEITGEAYFEVTRDVAMPFVVKKGNVEIQVLGTHFNVNAYTDEDNLKVTLAEGSVRVTQTATRHMRTIRPGEQIQVNAAGELKLVMHADVEQATAWKSGLFRFNNTPLQEVLRRMSRWYDVEVIYKDTPALRLGGVMSRNVNLSQAILLLQANGVPCKIENKKLIVMK